MKKKESREKVFYLAPLQGITSYIFRKVYLKHFGGFHYALSPFISTVSSKKAHTNHYKDILPINNVNSIPLIPQLMSNNGHDFLSMAHFIREQFGYSTINWNIGCPYPTVTRKKRGAGLLPHPDIIKRFLDEVFSQLPMRLSIKTRIGFLNQSEILPLMDIFNQYPLHSLIVHPRTAEQKYSGPINHDIFQEIVRTSSNPVILSGGITNISSFEMFSKKHPHLTRWMIGRPAISDPFLPQQLSNINPGGPSEKQNILKNFHADFFECCKKTYCGPKQTLGPLKEWWKYLAICMSGNEKHIKKILKCQDLPSYQRETDILLSEEITWHSFQQQ